MRNVVALRYRFLIHCRTHKNIMTTQTTHDKICFDSSFFEQLTKVADLIYFDGPLLSLFRDRDGRRYLYHWCDVGQAYHRWLIAPVHQLILEQYFNQDVTLREIILDAIKHERACLVGIDENLHYHNISPVDVDDIPHTHLPTDDSFYDFQPIFYEEPKIPIWGSLANISDISPHQFLERIYSKAFQEDCVDDIWLFERQLQRGAFRPAAALDWHIILQNIRAIDSIAKVLWDAYEELIFPQKAQHPNAGNYLLIGNPQEEFNSFFIGKDFTDRTIFVREFKRGFLRFLSLAQKRSPS